MRDAPTTSTRPSPPRAPRARRLALAGLTTGLGAAVCAALLVSPSTETAAAQSQTKVFLNGEATPVFFNDGDSFRVLGGEFKDSKARLYGYNTLESYGAVHEWGGWTMHELYVLAKMGTYNARDGVWNCETDGATDTYGRMLVWCPELAEAQIREGYAHAMSIDDNPGKPELLAAQADAIANRRGIWAHGVPEFILTSIHSKEEDTEGRGTYNRLVSSEDGHSVKWRHDDRYQECDRVCHDIYTVDEAALDALVTVAKADAELGPHLAELSDAEARAMLHEFAKYRHISRAIAPDEREAVKALLLTWVEAGKFGTQQRGEGACMLHVPFTRRFGGGKAECLK